MVRRGRTSPCYMGRTKRQQVETIKNDRNYHTPKQNKPHTKIKWNNYPLKQKNNAKNYKQNETKRENRTQKNYFLLLTYRKMKITQKLFAFLDGFTFSDSCETLDAVLEYYKIDAPYYSEIARAGEIAETYNEYKRLQNEGQKIDWNVLKLL